MSDLSNLSTESANESGVAMVITDPVTGEQFLNKDKKPMTIWLYGVDSKEFKAATAAIYSKFRGKKTPSYGQQEQNSYELLARCTKDFENLELNGKKVVYSHQAAVDLYKSLSVVKDQVNEFIADRSNFLGN